MDPSYLKIFFLLLGLLITFVSSSKIPREDESIEIPLKYQKSDDELKICGICHDKNGKFCKGGNCSELTRICRCGQMVHRCCLVNWFGDLPALDEFSCSNCDNNLHISDFLHEADWQDCGDLKKRKFYALKAFVSLNLPTKSIRVSDDKLTVSIEAERNGKSLIFTIENDTLFNNNEKRIFEIFFMTAVMFENLQLIRVLAKDHVDFSKDKVMTSKAFNLAIQTNCTHSIKTLLSLGLYSSFRSENFESDLMKSIKAKSFEIFGLILNSKPDSDIILVPGKSLPLLKVAIEQDQQRIISLLIQKTIIPCDTVLPDIKLDHSIISIMVKEIIKSNNLQAMKNVLLLNIPLSTVNFLGCVSVLEFAAIGTAEMFELLLSSGLSFFEDKEIEKFRCCYRAVENENYEIFRSIKYFNINSSKQGGLNVLHYAIHHSDIKIFETALKMGAQVNEPSDKYGYPLHRAILKDNFKIVTMLLEAGASLTVLDSRQNNAISICLQAGKVESFKAIAKFRGKNLFHTPDGLNSLQLAIVNRKIPLVEYLLSQGLTATKRNGTTDWMLPELAAIENGSEMLEFLFERCGVNIYEEVDVNQNPMMIAISKNRNKNVEIFLKYGYNPNRRILKGSSTLLHLAIKSGKNMIASLLIRYGADTNALDADGRTPFSYAQNSRIAEESKNMDEFL